ncbi:HlyD family efflux transporter periplasmic adaptor subunit [Candidatus Peregrinibacteria bacterium]|nr:HlyD family efflux transporter periplasmic adaptor subunit [Candidatus Peregrinibacteria bacterium]
MVKALKYIGILLLVIAIGGYIFFGREKKSQYEFIPAPKGELIQKVSVTGRIKPSRHIGYAFEKNGKISNIYVKVGDKVKAGAKLADLEHAELSAQLAQAKAAVDAAHAQLKQSDAALNAQLAKLNELKNGSRQEEILLAQTKVNAAAQSWSDAQKNLSNVATKADLDLKNAYGDVKDILNDAYTKADDALNKQIEQIVATYGGISPQITFPVADQQAEIDTESLRTAAGNSLKSFKQELDVLNTYSDFYTLDLSLIKAKNHLETIKKFVMRTDDVLVASIALPLSTLFSYKSNLIAAAANVNSAAANVNNQMQIISLQKIANQNAVAAAEMQMNNTQNSLNLAQAELNLKNAGALQTQIDAQKAQVEQTQAGIEFQKSQVLQAQANKQNVAAQFNKVSLISSINGTVARIEIEPGETTAPNIPQIFVISDEEFKIEAFVSEADIAKVQIGNSAAVTLDAYGDEVMFTAEVISIDPAETITEGIATYKTVLKFDLQEIPFKSGMTANIDIITARKEDAISVPQRTIIEKDGEKFVRVLVGETNKEEMKEISVITGLKGSDGSIEIIEGIAEGDKIIMTND